jgi:hypothetical protein
MVYSILKMKCGEPQISVECSFAHHEDAQEYLQNVCRKISDNRDEGDTVNACYKIVENQLFMDIEDVPPERYDLVDVPDEEPSDEDILQAAKEEGFEEEEETF